ncbi:MAG TPA: type VI secretion system lipoprotein TssJ [Vicinamibacterales bacterium]
MKIANTQIPKWPNPPGLRVSAARGASLLLAVLIMASCGKAPPPPPIVLAPPPKPAPAAMTIAASADTNPDASGRPSPVVVRVYQLKADAAFAGADFFPLFDDDQKVLGPELISREEYVLAPSERRIIEVPVADEARFLGAIAAFRDIRNSEWRVLVPAPRTGVTVAVERARIVLSPVQ